MAFYDTYIRQALVSENSFIGAPREEEEPPAFAAARGTLPAPFWQGHPEAVACYWKAWELAFANLRRPTPANGFVSNYIDTAFNDCLFMWDSAFITFFGRYGRRAFDFQRTLDNLYAKQHPDGFICREIREADGSDCFCRFDPASTGPNVLPWAEWEHFAATGDGERLARVFPVLLAFHRWLRAYRTWPDGSYWSSGWGSGMDNQPRLPAGMSREWYHGHLAWADACLQQALSAGLLLEMAAVLGREEETAPEREELARLAPLANGHLWDERTGFYHDRLPDGSLGGVKSIGAFWALLAGIVPRERLPRFIAHLEDEAAFNRPHRVPSLAADDPAYQPGGGYWLGGVWAPTNYMVLRGLTRAGADDLAHAIARNHLDNVVRVFDLTGTLWENYAPEAAAPGEPAKPDFVGWTGLAPIAVLLEYVFGLRPEAGAGRLVWDVRLLEEHGVRRYPFGRAGTVDLRCGPRSSAREKPAIEASADVPLALAVRWDGGSEVLPISPR